MITTWGEEVNAEQGGLRDYSYRAWAGMLKDFYYPRWKYYFDNNLEEPSEGWFEMERRWTLDKDLKYSDIPYGDSRTVIEEIKKAHHFK